MKNFELTEGEFTALMALRNRVGLVHALAACASHSLHLTPEHFYAFVADVESTLEAAVAAADERYSAGRGSTEGSAFLTVADMVALITVAHEGGKSTHDVGGLLGRLRTACELDPDMERVREAFDWAIYDRALDSRHEEPAHR